jgi:NH3-dependent NAD+ synthetase
MQYQRKVYMNKIQFKELQNFLPLYNIYNKVTKNILSEDTVKQLIDQNLESSNFKNRCRQEKLYYASNKEDSLL